MSLNNFTPGVQQSEHREIIECFLEEAWNTLEILSVQQELGEQAAQLTTVIGNLYVPIQDKSGLTTIPKTSLLHNGLPINSLLPTDKLECSRYDIALMHQTDRQKAESIKYLMMNALPGGCTKDQVQDSFSHMNNAIGIAGRKGSISIDTQTLVAVSPVEICYEINGRRYDVFGRPRFIISAAALNGSGGEDSEVYQERKRAFGLATIEAISLAWQVLREPIALIGDPESGIISARERHGSEAERILNMVTEATQ
ncbi:MAG: hypothetical protein LBQ11_02230 [Candidatus Nomurabacteria bacterium]|jgi:hypothetical protein|nr:hypothetical protein [Candidatus Nomurabacteria bacterium]